MDLTSISEDTFMCYPDAHHMGDMVEPKWASVEYQARVPGRPVWQIDSDYTIHRLGDLFGDVMACFRGKPVGMYRGQILSVHPDHGKRSLATAMILAAVPYRALPLQRNVTELGDKALRSAWRVANKQKATHLKLDERLRQFRVMDSATGRCELETDDLRAANAKLTELQVAGTEATIERPLD